MALPSDVFHFLLHMLKMPNCFSRFRIAAPWLSSSTTQAKIVMRLADPKIMVKKPKGSDQFIVNTTGANSTQHG